jgi:hypothetical protein
MDSSSSRHVSTHIDRPADQVYAYASDPAHLPEWAPGLCRSVTPLDGGRWVAESPMGRIELAFAPRNAFGVLDHWVTVASGETFYNPMRVVADGAGCEVVFSVRRHEGMTDAEFDRDAAAVLADLVALRKVVEGG